ncbi:MAG: NAD(P)/FAD-dependent oxidoreductase [Pseudomonadota bacterium]
MLRRGEAQRLSGPSLNRRRLLGASVFALAGCAYSPNAPQGVTPARVVVLGGGFAGATCARTIAAIAPEHRVSLIEPNRTYTACPFSNLVIAGMRDLSAQQFGYETLAAAGVDVIHARALDVDSVRRFVVLEDGQRLAYDRLIMAPGIEVRLDALPGYDAQAAGLLPHAWQAGAQTLLLARQLSAMPQGGVVALAVPQAPYRCPPGPYERASLIAAYLQQHNPTAKLLILDSKDRFSKQPLFEQAWRRHYGAMIEWRGASDGAAVVEIDAPARRLLTDFDDIRVDVANVIPPQRAGAIARRAGVADASGWCPIEPATFASRLQDHVHVIGDAAIANAMPKSAFAANAQARLCALQVVRDLSDSNSAEQPLSAKLLNTCYSFVKRDEAISVAGVYRPTPTAWQEIDGAGGFSPIDAPDAVRRAEARYAVGWFDHLTRSVFG